jgi:hypothetical protein
MIKPFEHRGVWWLPENPERRVYGVLKFDVTKDAILELFGSLRDGNASFLQADIILGDLNSGKPVTLLNCYEKNSQISIYGLSRSAAFPLAVLGVGCVFEGEHFHAREDIKFKKISFGLSHLGNWAGLNHIKREGGKDRIAFSYEIPDSIEAIIDDVGKLEFSFSAAVSHSFSSGTIEENIDISIESEEPSGFDFWWRTVYILRVFFSFATRHAVHPLYMHETQPVEVEYPDGTIGNTYQRIDVFFALSEVPDDSSTQGPRDMLFILKDVPNQIETCLQNWFKKADLLEPVYDLYFGMLSSNGMYPVHRYLSLAHCLETYHRRTSSRSALPKTEFKKRMEEIKNSVPTQYKDWILEKLSFSNEISLRQRLEEIMETYIAIFGQVSNQDTFIKKVVDTRNYLTHYDRKSKAKSATGEELHYISESLKILIEMCLLRELGIEDQVIRHVISRDRRQKHFLEPPVAIQP